MDPEAQLEGFITKYAPDIAAAARDAVARLRRWLPGADILVYDNYNALAIGFGSGERAGDVILSIAVYPRWLTLFLMDGASLDDPHRLLAGTGPRSRSHRLAGGAADLDDPRLAMLIDAAVAAAPPLPGDGGRLIIKSISAKQRPRRG